MAPHPDHSLTWDDVASWVQAGLITPEQFDAIKQFRSVQPQQNALPQPGRLNLVSIAYYFGAFVILLAYTFFMGLQWEALGILGQLVVTLITVAGLTGLGAALRRGGAETAGNLLIFVAVGITPLLVYTVQRALGVWPDEETLNYQDFYRLIRQQWLIMEVISIAAALIAVRLIRFPLLVLLVSFWGWYLSMDIVRWLTDSQDWSWGLAERGVGITTGVLMLAAGLFMHSRTSKDYSFWLYLFGNLIVFTHLSSLAFEYEGWVGLLFLAVSLGAVIASVVLQRRVFLIFGALGTYSYVSYLAFNVFEGALGFIFALAAVGLFIVLSAVFYQKVLRNWLSSRVRQRPASEPT